jgi:hypothetical protein
VDEDNGKNGEAGGHSGHSHVDAAGRTCIARSSNCPTASAEAAKTAMSINPVNRVNFGPIGTVARGWWRCRRQRFQFSLASTGSSTAQLTVSFLDGGPSDLRRRIIAHMNAWIKPPVSFVETRGVGKVRVSRNQAGYWSYLGTDIPCISRPTGRR